MKRAALLTVAMLCVASLVFAQGGSIGAFGDPGGTDCNLYDAAPGLMSVYIVHMNTAGATASQFYAPTPACFLGATYLSDSPAFPVAIGSSQTGIAIAYGACLPSPIHVLTIQFFGQGLTPECCWFKPEPHPSSSEEFLLEKWDCDGVLQDEYPGWAIINPDLRTYCGTPSGNTTWGAIKVLYQ